jgi:hypothetical protein
VQHYGADTMNELIHEALFPYPDGLAIVSKVATRRDPRGAPLRFEGLDGLDRGDGILDQQHTVHRAGPGQLWGHVVDEQQCRVSGVRRWSASRSGLTQAGRLHDPSRLAMLGRRE